MKLALPWEAETRPCVKVLYRSARRPLHSHTRALGRLVFLLQLAKIVHGWGKQISIQAFKIALNIFGLDNTFNRIYGGCMALRCGSRTFPAVQAFQFVVAVVQGIR